MKMTRFQALVAWAALLALTPALAQTNDDVPPDMVTPPRLSVAEGDVQFWRPGAAGWEPAQINTALAEGDSLNAGSDATVELQVGPRDFVRLMANSQLTFETHDAGMMHFRLGAGTASFDLRGGRTGQLVRIDTEGANIVVGGRGYYRISVSDDDTRIAVRNGGRATLTFADGRSRSIAAGEELIVADGGARVDSRAVPAQDSWDRWNDARSDYYASSASYRYVSPDVYGAADLDRYGSWREDSTYGWVWAPAVAPGWAPYSTGYWRWDPFYGWTWVDVEPWGWTTCHYGRWVSIGGGWAWAPGPRRGRVVYAPALVAFFQGGGGMSWVALGWGEPVVPWWGRPGFRGAVWWGGWGGPRVAYHEDRYVYRNASIATAVVTIRENDFGHRAVRGSMLPAPPIASLRPVHGDLPVHFVPAREIRRDAMPPRPRLEPMPRRDERRGDGGLQPEHRFEPRGGAPQQRAMPETDRSQPRQQVVIPAQRPADAGPREQRDWREQHAPREQPRSEPRVEERRPIEQPRVVAPVAPAIQPRVISPPPEIRQAPEMRREPMVPREMPRERRQEERVFQPQPRPQEMPRMQPQPMPQQRMEPPRMEAPRVEAPRPQAQPEQRRGGEREGDRGRMRGPRDRD